MSARTKIAVAGATGRVGSHVVDILRARGYDVVPMSRSTGVDIVTGDGLAEALAGVECIIDVATGPSPDEEEATAFFTAATRNLHGAGERAGVRRIVVISIIGIDHLTGGYYGGYYAAKVAHEQAMLSGAIPAQILRASQFHEFVETLMEWGRQGDTVYLPKMRTQLVSARTVAEALIDLATSPDSSGSANSPIPEIAGPREESLVEAARLLAAKRGDPVQIEGVSNLDDPATQLYESGGLLPSPHAALAGPTFAEWLDSTS
jgi:uncharacterized protein YbjT (DUF2867 family)